MSKREQVEEALQNSEALPAGPAVMARLGELCRDPNATARDLGKVLQLDPALTTRILKQVNSSFYGLSSTIKTVTHAVVILGFQEVKNIAFTVPVANLFEDNMRAPGLDISVLWANTLEMACLSRCLSYHISHPVPEQVFVANILSATGMVILNSILADDYAEVVQSCFEPEDLPQTEEEELGISHIQVSRQLAEKWHFPPDLIDAMSYNYAPVRDGEVLTEAGLIFAARRLRNSLRNGNEADLALSVLPPNVAEAFSFTPEAVGEAWEKAQSEAGEAHAMLSGG